MTMKKITPNKSNMPNSNWINYGVYFLSIIIFVSTLIYRLNYINAPLEGDESIYTYLGRIAIRGGIPYIDFYEMKPPLLFYLYGITDLLIGSPFGFHIPSIIISIVVSYLIYLILIRQFSKHTSALAACLFFWMNSSPFLSGNYLQSEHFVNLFNLISLFFLYRKEMNNKNIFFSGLFFGLALLIKQTALFFLPPLIILCSIQNKVFSKFIIDFLKLTFAISIPILLAFMMIVFTGALDDAKFWLIDFPTEYALTNTSVDKLRFLKLFSIDIIGFQYILWALLLLSVFLLLYKVKDKNNLYFLSFLFFSSLAIIPGFRYYGHYWLLIIPSAAFCLAYLIETSLNNNKLKLVFLSIFSILMIVQLKSNSKIFYSKNPKKEISNIYKPQHLDIIEDIGTYLNKIIKPKDDLLVLGAMPQIYLYTNRIACTRHVWQPMLNYSNAKTMKMRNEMLSDIEKSRPKYIVFSFNPFHWGLKDSKRENHYTQSYLFAENNYERIAVFESISRKKYIGNEAKSINIVANMYVVYKLIGSS